ncbi:YdaS family helix-turn-helix protein [Bradyrhizobium sp. 141]|uniref:transcriptional regulator n=1 Tax=Bradyrhizobium sp. 141 TaxID=2782617 RepID=UPI001FF835B4|nr:YdaS family helix-turn-helix protein [Bradyrhizobium sp. 141]MCK1718886.1 helix-turn-helix domain-containing protein [Bradyrhizobium sp. 141]
MSDAASIAELKAAALDEAKRAVKGNTGLSRALAGEITPQAIAQWKQVPAERVLKVEKATGIPRHRLRPDLYPCADQDVAAS